MPRRKHPHITDIYFADELLRLDVSPKGTPSAEHSAPVTLLESLLLTEPQYDYGGP